MEPYQDRLLTLHGICNRVRGDGDSHMRGMSCLLTGIELFPGNIQGGSHTPAGWASGISIDQEIKNFFQSRPETRTRFGSLEFGVAVPNRADPWTRMVYAGPNKPIAPIDDPYQMFAKLYGRLQDQESLTSILDDVQDDLQQGPRGRSAREDRQLLEEHETFVREMEQELQAASEDQSATTRARTGAGREERERQHARSSAGCRSICWSTASSATWPAWRRCSSPTRSARPACVGWASRKATTNCPTTRTATRSRRRN